MSWSPREYLLNPTSGNVATNDAETSENAESRNNDKEPGMEETFRNGVTSDINLEWLMSTDDLPMGPVKNYNYDYDRIITDIETLDRPSDFKYHLLRRIVLVSFMANL